MTRAGAGARAGRLGTGLPSRGSTSSARLVAVSRPLIPEPFGRSPSDVQGEEPPTPRLASSAPETHSRRNLPRVQPLAGQVLVNAVSFGLSHGAAAAAAAANVAPAPSSLLPAACVSAWRGGGGATSGGGFLLKTAASFLFLPSPPPPSRVTPLLCHFLSPPVHVPRPSICLSTLGGPASSHRCRLTLHTAMAAAAPPLRRKWAAERITQQTAKPRPPTWRHASSGVWRWAIRANC